MFLDFPIGCPAGKPHEPTLQRDVLRAAFAAAPTFGEPWHMVELPFQWSADGSRAWEEELKAVYRRGRHITEAHGAAHRAVAESLHGREREFTIRCNC